MTTDDLPKRVQEFITNHIDSVELLTVLLLLYSDPEKEWTVAEINRELRSAESSILKRLNDLYSRGVLARVPETQDRHRFTPSSPEMRETIRALAEAHQLRPYKVIEAIYARPSTALRAFVDAFRFRGERE